MDKPRKFRQILGVQFFNGNEQEAIDEISRTGGLVVVPAAPALKNLAQDEQYRESLLNANFAIADSALMVLIWNLTQKDRIRKLSGLKYLRALLERTDFRDLDASFWVMPAPASARRNIGWLREEGIQLSEENVYLAPTYGRNAVDPELLRRIEEKRPRHIVLGLGGGTQERLGFYLKSNLSYQPAIHCIGAAIAFLSGDQVRIPVWADHLGLGWLLRCISDPRRYGPRYWDARHLAPLMLRYRDRLPVVPSSSL